MEYSWIIDDGAIGFKENIGSQHYVITWTPEREAAFVEIDSALEGMVKKLSGTLCNTDKTKFMLDNKIKLLG